MKNIDSVVDQWGISSLCYTSEICYVQGHFLTRGGIVCANVAMWSLTIYGPNVPCIESSHVLY